MDIKTIEEILSKYQTPLYCFDIDILKNRIKYLRYHLPQNVKICYAAKANTFILKEVENEVDYYEICSPGELDVCKNLGIPMKKIVLSGVYKSEEDLSDLIKNKYDIRTYTIESQQQLLLLEKISGLYQTKIDVILRCTSGNQFGMDKDFIRYIIKNREKFSFLNIKGIQYFSGTQKHSIKRLEKEITSLIEFMNELYELYEYKVEVFEYGPGLPIDYFIDSTFNEEEHLKGFSNILNKINPNIEVILEMGRSIAASCGFYLTKVVEKKTNKNQNYAIVDGGIHHLVYYGQTMAMKIPQYDIYQKHEEETNVESSESMNWNICGALCTINDILVKQLPVKNLRINDVFIFKNAGAYCPTEAISLFLTRDLPEVILMDNKKIQSVRKKLKTSTINTPNYNLF